MFPLISVAVLVYLTSALIMNQENTQADCSNKQKVGIHNEVFFTNPNWPGPYRQGELCRWEFKCPRGYQCRLKCADVGLPQSKNCYMDRLLVSRSGDSKLRDARRYCGRQKINIRSHGSSLMMVLVTSKDSPGGRFRCLVKATKMEGASSELRWNPGPE